MTRRIAHFDAFSGIAGDMAVGALLDCGLELDDLAAVLDGLGVPGLGVARETRERSGIVATKFIVTGTEGDHPHRSWKTVRDILEGGGLAEGVAERALRIFTVLAEAEGAVHGVSPDEVHFHEVGAIDSIADVVGAAWALDALGVDEISVSALPLGRGMIRTAHGRIPVPAPATAKLLEGFDTRIDDGQGEMVTPTGAAILRALAKPLEGPADFRVERVGFGAGDRELDDRPNLLRVFLGRAAAAGRRERLLTLEANVDDANPEIWEWVCERLFEAGALDVTLFPVQMKKGRPATMISVLCDPGHRERLSALLFAETTTLGVRSHEVSRVSLAREIRSVETPWGEVRVKVAEAPDGTKNFAPEYDDCRRVAKSGGVALKTVYLEALRRC